ncbi:hypothetical protein [Chitinophaga solisilvae]|nr:hypothetical protein [Chitinophaga solisilvae]
MPATLQEALLKTGGSQMDMYTGHLTPETIFEEIIAALQQQGIDTAESYAAHLAAGNGFMTVVLTDGSRWILRLSDKPAQPVHLHPGRYSPHSLRIKAAALKTAMAYKSAMLQGVLTGQLLTDINEVRRSAGLSPVRRLDEIRHIIRILQLIGCPVSEEI